MKLVSKILAVFVVAIIAGGCATGQKSSVISRNLKADHVVYFEQADRVPKDVLLAPYSSMPGTNGEMRIGTMSVADWEKILPVLEKLFAIAPELAKSYSNERMNNALLNRRMLFIGYDDTEQLKAIKDIVEEMGNSIEYLTPQE